VGISESKWVNPRENISTYKALLEDFWERFSVAEKKKNIQVI